MRACTSVVDGWMEFGALSLRATHCGRDERVSGCRMHDAVDEERDAFVLVSLSSKPVYTNASSDRTRRAAPRRCFFSVPHEFTLRIIACAILVFFFIEQMAHRVFAVVGVVVSTAERGTHTPTACQDARVSRAGGCGCGCVRVSLSSHPISPTHTVRRQLPNGGYWCVHVRSRHVSCIPVFDVRTRASLSRTHACSIHDTFEHRYRLRLRRACISSCVRATDAHISFLVCVSATLYCMYRHFTCIEMVYVLVNDLACIFLSSKARHVCRQSRSIPAFPPSRAPPSPRFFPGCVLKKCVSPRAVPYADEILKNASHWRFREPPRSL